MAVRDMRDVRLARLGALYATPQRFRYHGRALRVPGRAERTHARLTRRAGTAPAARAFARSDDLDGTAEAERDGKLVQMHVELRRQLLARPDYCARCWIHRQHCVCAAIPVLPCPHRVLLYMHHKGGRASGGAAAQCRPRLTAPRAPTLAAARRGAAEYGRLSNTGKVLLAALPHAELFLGRDPADEVRFHSALAGAAGRCCVLFPSATSVAVRRRPKHPRHRPDAWADLTAAHGRAHAACSTGTAAGADMASVAGSLVLRACARCCCS